MNTFGLPKKKVLWIQFCSSVTQSNALSIFFIFDPQSEGGFVFRLSTCTLIFIESYRIT